ncbi:hypothetical protein [Agrobacterium tumefaciens]|uniref:hypothetical protein n=1 Tax=Agrobacterium tumefaciens TaxID=358 RepID=UPI000A89421B|nr:hypothetical protein [Agrobacterium tumefaciens]
MISDGGVVKAGLDQPPLASLAQTGAGTSIFTGVIADPPETGKSLKRSLSFRSKPRSCANDVPRLTNRAKMRLQQLV